MSEKALFLSDHYPDPAILRALARRLRARIRAGRPEKGGARAGREAAQIEARARRLDHLAEALEAVPPAARPEPGQEPGRNPDRNGSRNGGRLARRAASDSSPGLLLMLLFLSGIGVQAASLTSLSRFMARGARPAMTAPRPRAPGAALPAWMQPPPAPAGAQGGLYGPRVQGFRQVADPELPSPARRPRTGMPRPVPDSGPGPGRARPGRHPAQGEACRAAPGG